MAIEITNKPMKWAPLYNDNWVQFTYSGTQGHYATIESEGHTARLMHKPNSNLYSYELSQMVKHTIDLNKEGTKVLENTWTEPTGMAKASRVLITIKAREGNSTLATQSFNFTYVAGSMQVYENNIAYRDLQVLGSPYKTYFKGYPFWLDMLSKDGHRLSVDSPNGHLLQRLTDTINFKLLNSIQEYELEVRFNQTARIWIDKVEEDWAINDFIFLNDNENVLDILNKNTRGDIIDYTRVSINKEKTCEGYYLKWLNRDGGYSTYLFDRNMLSEYNVGNIGNIVNWNPSKILEANNNVKNIGKESFKEIKVEARFNFKQLKDFEDLTNSPDIFLWTSTRPYIAGRWVSVESTIESSYRLLDEKGISKGSILIPNFNAIR